MEHRRRTFLIGLGGLLVAPAIVRASSLMPVSTNLMRFGASDALVTKVTYQTHTIDTYKEIKYGTKDTIIAAKKSPFSGNLLLLTDKGEIIDTHGLLQQENRHLRITHEEYFCKIEKIGDRTHIAVFARQYHKGIFRIFSLPTG